MKNIKVDFAFLLDTFKLLNLRYVPIFWCHLRFESLKQKSNMFLLDKDKIISDLNIKPKIYNFSVKRLTNIGLLLKHENNFYSLSDERSLCNYLRTQRRERIYTRFAYAEINKKFFYEFIKIINNPLDFRIYYLLYLFSQLDLWPDTKRIRCRYTLQEIKNLVLPTTKESDFVKSFQVLQKHGLIILDQFKKVHINRFDSGDSFVV